jgi:hypothetical protein
MPPINSSWKVTWIGITVFISVDKGAQRSEVFVQPFLPLRNSFLQKRL